MTTRIRVDEGEDAPITLFFKRRAADGTTVPLDLSGISALDLIVKTKLADPDNTPKFVYHLGSEIVVVTDGTQVGAKSSSITVNIAGSDQTPPANYYFKVVKTKSGKKETIAKGVWTVENT